MHAYQHVQAATILNGPETEKYRNLANSDGSYGCKNLEQRLTEHVIREAICHAVARTSTKQPRLIWILVSLHRYVKDASLERAQSNWGAGGIETEGGKLTEK